MSWTLTLDIPVTRRQRIHQLRDELGKLVSSHQLVSEALMTAQERQVLRLEIISPHGHWLMDFEPLPF